MIAVVMFTKRDLFTWKPPLLRSLFQFLEFFNTLCMYTIMSQNIFPIHISYLLIGLWKILTLAQKNTLKNIVLICVVSFIGFISGT